jgi:ribosomal protein S4
LMFAEVERRIDVFLFRCCFVHSVYEARRLVIHGDVMLNGKKVRRYEFSLYSSFPYGIPAPKCKYATRSR